MDSDAFIPSFTSVIATLVSKTESRFYETEQQLLEQKSFEDMAFSTSGFCENGDFFYTIEILEGPTAREQLAGYFVLREKFEQFSAGLKTQLDAVAPENKSIFESWIREQLIEFESGLLKLGT
jgi:hypothetical protein